MKISIVWRCPLCNLMVRHDYDFGPQSHPQSSPMQGPFCSSDANGKQPTLTGTAVNRAVMEPVHVAAST